MFSQTKSCPGNRNDWEKQGMHLNCSITNGVYHCLLNEKGKLGEICRKGQPVQVQPNYCPQYNDFARSVTTVLCNKSADCPYEAFKSNEVYKYPVCLEVSQRDPFVYDDSTTSLPWPTIIGWVVGVFLVILTVVAIVCYRKRRSQKTPNGEDELIPLLARETPFYKTSIFHEADSFLKDGGKILCLIGKWGSGKSSTAKQVFKSRTGRTPIVIEDILKYDMNTCKDSVIVEEPLPREDISEVEKINRIEKIIALCKQMQETDKKFVVITLTEEAWKIIAEEIKKFDVKEYRCINLNWKKLSKGDRIHILHTIFHFYNPDKPFSMVEGNISRFNAIHVGFPEICTLFSKCSKFQKAGIIFFNRPLRNLSSYLEKMCQTLNTKDKFLALVYMSLNYMKIDVTKSNNNLKELFRSCGLNTDYLDLTSIIPVEFVVEEEPSVFVIQHEVIKRMTLKTFGELYFSELLQYSSKKDLEGWIKQKDRHILTPFAEVSQQASEIEPILEIDHEQWVEFQRKMGISHQPECEKKND